ncbi:hypothetical protein CYMTET_39814 [Cymbomonas tetramitiformis]|uniref:Uncharacterized protein n=1 Tax=Cymbomonas tetramitiformis TaxID=36881 RepID=A0AAE0C9E1_9CHLO|nr:hypothetical protein CYMTET_39817 [Cymbomonas tetramitiformis]KAK3250828.1 hypothetical protein CYMTET_39814 [Cymbomonas tetramitiformis]
MAAHSKVSAKILTFMEEPRAKGLSKAEVDGKKKLLVWSGTEKASARFLAKRHWGIFQVFLALKPGSGQQIEAGRGLPLDQLLLCQALSQNGDPQKPRSLPKLSDWCFSFNFHDGYHPVGIDPAFQE